MKRITRIIRPIICMAVLLFAMTTAVMGCYQKETESIDIPGRTPSGTSVPQPSATPAGEVIPSVDRQAELAEARAKNPDAVAWLYMPGTEVDDPVVQAEDNGYYLKLDEDTVLTLSTCCRKYDKANTGNQRLVVMAKLLPEGATAQEFSVSLVDSPEMP